MNFRSIYAMLPMMIAGFFSFAQEDLPTSSVVIEKEFEVELLDFDKISITPDPQQTVERSSYPYTLSDQLFSVSYPPPQIKPLGYRNSISYESYAGYLRLGYGLPQSLYGKADIGGFVSDNLRLDFNGKYRDVEDDSYLLREGSELHTSLKATYLSDRNFVGHAAVNYDSNENYLYGFDHDTDLSTIDAESPKNAFDRFGIQAGVSNSIGTENPFLYKIQTGFRRFSTNHDLTENAIKIEGEVQKWLGNIPISLAADVHLLEQSRDTSLDQNLDIYRIRPASGYHGESFRIEAELNLAYFQDEFTVFPRIELGVNLLGSGLQLYGGIDGDVLALSHDYIAEDNPFIRPQLNQYAYQDYRDYYAGVQGIVSRWKYSAQLGLKHINNLNLYNATTLSDGYRTTRYDILLDTADVLYVKGNLELPLSENIKLMSGVVFNSYSMENQEEAWYLPDLLLDAGLQLSLLDNRLNINSTASFASKVHTPFENDAEDRKVNSLFDLSVGTDWFIHPNIGLFLDINNILDNKYARFFDYQNVGLNVNFGVVGRF